MFDVYYDYVFWFFVFMCNIMRYFFCFRVGFLFIDWVCVLNSYIFVIVFLFIVLGGIEGFFCIFLEYGIFGFFESFWFYVIIEY